MQLPFSYSSQSVSVVVNGDIHTLVSGEKNFEKLIEALKEKDHDEALITNLVSKESAIKAIGNARVTVSNGQVYFDGTAVNNSLTNKIINILEDGFSAEPWINFMVNLDDNPSFTSRNCLYNFLDHFNVPFTEDGHFIAFKRVRSDFKDIYTGTMDNSPGNVVEVNRRDVDEDPTRTCSHGLHVAASVYLDSYASADKSKTLMVKVNPADVVAVPKDYGFAKMRVCRYEVLQEIEPKQMGTIEVKQVYGEQNPGIIWDTYEGSIDIDDVCEGDFFVSYTNDYDLTYNGIYKIVEVCSFAGPTVRVAGPKGDVWLDLDGVAV